MNRYGVGGAAACLLCLVAMHAQAAPRRFSVPAQPAHTGLQEIGRQGDVQILAAQKDLRGKRVNAVQGVMEAVVALERALEGSGLRVETGDGRTLYIRPVRTPPDEARPRGGGPPPARSPISAPAEVSPVIVTGTGLFSRRRAATRIVESVSYDPLEALVAESSVASLLIGLPGASAAEDADQARYITIQGVASEYNRVSIDGLGVASIGENGAGARQVNLQMIPGDMTSRVDVAKVFSADLPADAIGGAVDIVSFSAFDWNDRSLFADVYSIYSTYAGDGGLNAGGEARRHWGQGLKASFADRFGPDEQFGLVLSARYEDRARNSAKIWQDTKYYYSNGGAFLTGPDTQAGWNGLAVPYHFGFGSFSNHIVGGGGSGKLEWRPDGDRYYASLLAYDYKRRESSTMNTGDIYNKSAVYDQTAEGGREQINSIYVKWRFNQWDRNNRGLLARLDRRGQGLLSLRAGTTRESFKDIEPYIVARTYPARAYVTYTTVGGLPRMVAVDPAATVLGSVYKLSSTQTTYNFAAETLDHVRIDYDRAFSLKGQDFRFATGGEWRDLNIGKNVDSARYKTGAVMTDYLFDPGYMPLGSAVIFPWLKGRAFLAESWKGLTADAANTAYYSRISDYAYGERVGAAYASLTWSDGVTTLVGGVRYDTVAFEATSPVVEEGVAAGRTRTDEGGYDHWLPSLVASRSLGANLKLRASFSRTLGRPSPADIASPYSSVCLEGGDGGERCSITRGNPGLRPRRSRNLDLSLERYYAADEGMISLSVFDKAIDDDIYDLTVNAEVDGQLYAIRQPRNAERSSVRGVEASWTRRGLEVAGRRFDVSANASRIQGEMTYIADDGVRTIDRVINQPSVIANLSLTYRPRGVDGGLKVSARYRGAYLSELGAKPWEDEGRDELTVIDLAAWCAVAEGLSLKFEVANLFNQQPRYLIGKGLRYLSQIDEYGRGFYLHLTYRPWSS